MSLDAIPWDQDNLLVVFDYETSGLHRDDGAYPSTLGLRWGSGPDAWAAIPVDQGVMDKPGTIPVLFGDAPNVDPAVWLRVHDWLGQQRLVAHNAKADLWFAWAGLRKHRELQFDLSDAYHWDTLVVESLLHPGQRVSLELVAEREGWNEPYREADTAMKHWVSKPKNRVHKQLRYDLAPWDILEPYLKADLDRTWRLFWKQVALVGEGLLPRALLRRELDLVRCLFDMERRGLPYRVGESLAASAQADREMAEIAELLPFDPHSKQQTSKWFMDHGLKLYKTEKGDWQLDQAAVNRAVEAEIPGADQYQRWTKLQTARGLWYLGWAERTGADGRVRADYRQVKTWEGNQPAGTISGRFAVSRVNVQAIPRAYQIPDGYPTMQQLIRPSGSAELYEVDISQAEMRVVASLSGCDPMLEGFRAGFDAHDSTTRLIWGIEPGHPDWGARRQVAKRLGFGVIYGAGIRTLAQQISLFTGEDLGETGVRELWEQYRAAFPQLFRYNREMQRLVERRRYLVLPGGKVRKFHETEFSYKAMNAMIQGSVAVVMSEVMLTIDRELPGILVGQVHDSVLLEVDHGSEAEAAGSLVSSTFESWFRDCPFPVEVAPYADK